MVTLGRGWPQYPLWTILALHTALESPPGSPLPTSQPLSGSGEAFLMVEETCSPHSCFSSVIHDFLKVGQLPKCRGQDPLSQGQRLLLMGIPWTCGGYSPHQPQSVQ